MLRERACVVQVEHDLGPDGGGGRRQGAQVVEQGHAAAHIHAGHLATHASFFGVCLWCCSTAAVVFFLFGVMDNIAPGIRGPQLPTSTLATWPPTHQASATILVWIGCDLGVGVCVASQTKWDVLPANLDEVLRIRSAQLPTPTSTHQASAPILV